MKTIRKRLSKSLAGLLSFVMIVGLLSGVSSTIKVYGSTSIVNVVEDAYTDDSFSPGVAADGVYMSTSKDSTNGTIVNYVGTDSVATNAKAALKFTLDSSNEVLQEVKLRLYVKDVVGSPLITVKSTNDTGWLQSTASFPTQMVDDLLVNYPVSLGGGWKTFYLSIDTIANLISSPGQSTLSLVVSESNGAGNYFNFVADDNADENKAQLVLVFADPAYTVEGTKTTATPVAGANNQISLTVKRSDGVTDTNYTGDKVVTITGYDVAPNGTAGTLNGTYLETDGSTDVTLTFTNGVSTVNLNLNTAVAQTIQLSAAGVVTPTVSLGSITPTPAAKDKLGVNRDITAPAAYLGAFAVQPKISVLDTYGNVRTSDNATVITASRNDGGSWTLGGTLTATATAGIATFTNLSALANIAAINNASIAFTATGATQTVSSDVTLLPPGPSDTVSVVVADSAPVVGTTHNVTFTVENQSGNTDTTFSGSKSITITGYEQAPNNSYGQFGSTVLDGSGSGVATVSFTAGVGVATLKLNKADSQSINFSVEDVTSPTTGAQTIIPVSGAVSAMVATTQPIGPVANGGVLATQPIITLKDAYGNTCVTDSTTIVTASKADGGAWTLTGTVAKTAVSGIVTFTNLGATNNQLISDAQLAFNANALSQIVSDAMTLPLPAPHVTVLAQAATSTPTAGAANAITFTVKDDLGNTDTTFNGNKTVTLTGFEEAAYGSYGKLANIDLDNNGSASDTVNFVNGVGTVNISLNKADLQSIVFDVSGVDNSTANTLSISPVHAATDSLFITQYISAPLTNASVFNQQPIFTLKDAFGNTCDNDSTTVVTASKQDAGSWTLTGTVTQTAVSGVVTFTNLGATNSQLVSNARVAFNSTGLGERTSSAMTLPAPAPHKTVAQLINTLTPVAGAMNLVTFTVKDTLGQTDTNFNGYKTVTVTGYEQAPNNSYGALDQPSAQPDGFDNGMGLFSVVVVDHQALESDGSTYISVLFTNGIGEINLTLNKADPQSIVFSVAGVDTPTTNAITVTPVHAVKNAMAVTQNVTAPVTNAGVFAQQPIVAIQDAYGNVCTSDNSTQVTVSKTDGGSWTLTGTVTQTATAGIVTFTNLGGTNNQSVSNAQLAFDASAMTQITSNTMTLPAPAPHKTVVLSMSTLTPTAGAMNQVTLTVKDALGQPDINFDGYKAVSISGYEQAPNNSYGGLAQMNILPGGYAEALGLYMIAIEPFTELESDGSTYVAVPFENGVGSINLILNKADPQSIIFSLSYVDTPTTNAVTVTPVPKAAVTMTLTQNVSAPAINGGTFAQQPKVTLKDEFGNICTNDNGSIATISKGDSNSWTLTGTTNVAAVSGVVSFIVGATNSQTVTGAWLTVSMAGITSVTTNAFDLLPAPPVIFVPTQPTPIPAPTPAAIGAEVIVDDQIVRIGTARVTTEGGVSTTTIIVDDQLLQRQIAIPGGQGNVVIPFSGNSDVALGSLNGQSVSDMEDREAVLEIRTDNVTYTLPASEINIDNVSEQLGSDIQLKDIRVNISVGNTSDQNVRIVADTANRNSYQIVVQPVDFEITCTYGDKKVEVAHFNGYVERTIAIPEGIDPSKITTGIVLNKDGTFSHVPTSIIKIGNKYYAKINSLTNSTYSVVFSPKTFDDIATHWANGAITDLASRLIVEGVSANNFEPNREMTRGEFTTLLVKALGLMKPNTGKNTFADVTASDWYYDAVSIAKEYQLITGFEDGSFKPMVTITREQAMVMIARAMALTELKPDFKTKSEASVLAAFTDQNSLSVYAKNAVATCIQTEIIIGKPNQIIAPKELITRAEVATMIRNLLVKSKLI